MNEQEANSGKDDLQSIFLKAADHMYSAEFSKNDMVNVINAAIQLLQEYDVLDQVSKLGKLRDVVNNGEFSIDKLRDITGYIPETSALVGDVELTQLQMLRFKRTHPVAYEEYTRGTNKGFTQKIMGDMLDTFPTPPSSPIVFKDAIAGSGFWARYSCYWSTCGGKEGSAYAWAFNHNLYLVHFFDNIFVSGVIIYSEVIDDFIKLYETGVDAILDRSSKYGEVNFRCTQSVTEYVIYVKDEEVMRISSKAMRMIHSTLSSCKFTPMDVIRDYTKDLILGE